MSQPTKKTGAIWPRMIFIGYSLFAAVMIGFAVYTSGQNNDLVMKDYYGQEHVFQENLAASERALRLEKTPVLTIDREGRTLEIVVEDGAWETPTTAVISWYRSSDAQMDFSHTVDPFGPGTTSLNVEDLPSGFWKVSVHWELNGKSYLLHDEVMLP